MTCQSLVGEGQSQLSSHLQPTAGGATSPARPEPPYAPLSVLRACPRAVPRPGTMARAFLVSFSSVRLVFIASLKHPLSTGTYRGPRSMPSALAQDSVDVLGNGRTAFLAPDAHHGRWMSHRVGHQWELAQRRATCTDTSAECCEIAHLTIAGPSTSRFSVHTKYVSGLFFTSLILGMIIVAARGSLP